VTHARAHVTEVSVSEPNFNGTRVVTGKKYNRTPITRASVAMCTGLL
jgi:hypothetical protein